MKIQSLHIQNFTVFEDQKFDFCDGINVFIGANATGKTHALKAMYTLSQARSENLHDSCVGVFRPADGHISHLARHSDTQLQAAPGVEIRSFEGETRDLHIVPPIGPGSEFGEGSINTDVSGKADFQPLFFPPREMLSAYEGFTALYKKREISFDQTYCDICDHLGVPVLRKESLSSGTSALISELTDILGGSVIEKGGRFYVKQPTGKLLEAHLLAEGHRKLAMLVRLIANGEIGKDTILLWDEPESGLNPKLITKVAKAIRRLAAAGVQVFVATHDYLLTGELSVLAEYKQKPDVPTRFFAFSRSDDDPAAPVSVQSGNLLQDLSDNPILKEFVAHYDREERLFAASQHKEGTAR